MAIKRCVLTISTLLLSVFSSSSNAESYSTNDGAVELRVYGGYLTGESGEFVYDAYGSSTGIPGYKVSQLNWKIDNAYVIGIGASYSASRQLRLSVDYSRNATEGSGTMDDYDWLYVGYDWSHWSRSDNTAVTEISNVNVNGEMTLFQLQSLQTDFTLLAGYKVDHFRWVASGGYGIYSVSSYRDTHVIFQDIPVITYEQNYSTPYIGIGVHVAKDTKTMPAVLTGHVLYSHWVTGYDEDTHHSRNLFFRESGDGGKWVALKLSLDLYLSRSMAVSFGYAYQNYAEIKAGMTITDLTTGNVTYFPGPSAGLDHSSSMLSAQISYRL